MWCWTLALAAWSDRLPDGLFLQSWLLPLHHLDRYGRRLAHRNLTFMPNLQYLRTGFFYFYFDHEPVPSLDLICWELQKYLNMPPRTIIPILVLSASAYSIEWVVMMTALFLSLCEIFATTCHMKRRASVSIPADGSSSGMMGGLLNVAIATESLRLLPPYKVPAAFSLWSAKLRQSIAFWISLYWSDSGIPLSQPQNHKCSSTVIKGKMASCWGQ